MRLFTAAVLLSLFVSLEVAIAAPIPVLPASQLPGSNVHKIPLVNSLIAQYDNACANFAASMVTGVEDPQTQQWKKQCAMHPTVSICQETVSVIKESRGSNEGLVCAGGAASLSTGPVVVASGR
jgi:hypothetical protein